MIVRPVRTYDDYNTALARIDELMDAPEGSADADELEIISALVQKFEAENYAVDVPATPLAAIRFRMEQQGLTQRDLEPYIGSSARVSQILSGKRSLSVDMIRALNEGLKIPLSSLIQLDTPTLIRESAAPSKPVLNKLQKLGFNVSADTFQNFVNEACGDHYSPAFHRRTRTERTSKKTDSWSLLAWQAAILTKAKKDKVRAKFEQSALTDDFLRNLAKLSTKKEGPLLAVQRLRQLGIVVVILPHLPETYLDGAAMISPEGVPVIGLTLRRDRVDNFWFTLLHECAHVRSHLFNLPSGEAIFDDLELEDDSDVESQADTQAETALIEPNLWKHFYSGAYMSTDEVLRLANTAEVHPAIVAGRWQRTHKNFVKFSKLLGHREIKVQFGYDD